MKLISKIAIGFVIYLFFMVILFPANIALSFVSLPKNIQISGVSGSIWSGSANLITVEKRQLEQFNWSLSALPLLLGRVNIDFTLGNRTTPVRGKGQLSYLSNGINVSNLTLDLPLSFLLANQKLPFKTNIDGELSIAIDSFKQGLPWCENFQGKALISMLDVNNQYGQYPLGDLGLAMQCVKGQIQLSTDETKNTQGLAGTFLLQDKGQYKINARIREMDSQDPDLREALSFLGKKDAQGYYPLKFNGRLPKL